MAKFHDAMRMRFPAALGLGIVEEPIEKLLGEWVLPHVPDAHKVSCLAHGSAQLARAALDDLDHMVNKRFDAPGDLLATACGSHWHRLWSCIPKKLAVGRQKWTGPVAECANALASAGLESMRAVATAASEKIQDGFSTPDWTSADGNKISGVCEKVITMLGLFIIGIHDPPEYHHLFLTGDAPQCGVPHLAHAVLSVVHGRERLPQARAAPAARQRRWPRVPDVRDGR